MIDLAAYDFIDFGSSKGGSIDFAIRRLGGSRGFGIDLDPKNVRRMREGGYDCIEGDITGLQLPGKSVRFVVMSHILEHLRGLDAVARALRAGMELATDFLFVQGPFFDADAYLEGLGFKLYWSDWHGHPCHLTTGELDVLLRALGITGHEFRLKEEIRDSSHPAVHPLDSPGDQHDYDGAVHPPKSKVPFRMPVYREMICYVPLRPLKGWERILTAKRDAIPLPRGRKDPRPDNHRTGDAFDSAPWRAGPGGHGTR